jgi:hypothetical protein
MSSRSRAHVAGAAVALLLVTSACGGGGGPAAAPSVTPTAAGDERPTAAPVSGSWRPVAHGPLSARAGANAVWTGSEVLVFGGHDRACDVTRCHPALDDVLRDGAAYDPADDTWRKIASAPVPVLHAETALAEDTLYSQVPAPADRADQPEPSRWFAYDISGDTWSEIWPGPEGSSPIAVGPGLFARRWSPGNEPAFAAYDPVHDRWTDLPDDELGAGRSRGGLGDDRYLYSIAYDGDGGEDDARASVAAYDPRSGSWSRLPDPPLGAVPRVFSGGRLVDPDGAYTAAYDPVARTWTVSPGQQPPAVGAGPLNHNALRDRVVGAHAVVASPNLLLDSIAMTWTAIPPHEALGGDGVPGETVADVAAAWAGDRLFAWGGVRRWDQTSGMQDEDPDAVPATRLRDEGWVWVP